MSRKEDESKWSPLRKVVEQWLVEDVASTSYEKPRIEDYVEETDGLRLRFHVSQMYNEATITFDHLKALSQKLGTRSINLSDGYCAWGGCETCDYGSRYDVPISVSNIGSKPAHQQLRKSDVVPKGS